MLKTADAAIIFFSAASSIKLDKSIAPQYPNIPQNKRLFAIVVSPQSPNTSMCVPLFV